MSKYTVGRAVREARTDERLGVRELARMSGVSAGQISRIENGEVDTPAASTLEAIAFALDRNAEALKILAASERIGDLSYDIGVLRTWDPDEPFALPPHWTEEGDGPLVEGDYVYAPWTDEMKAARDESYEVYRHFAHDYFRCVSTSYIVEATGLEAYSGRDLADLFRSWSRLTDTRKRQVALYAAEQAALSAADRRGTGSPSLRAELVLVNTELDDAGAAAQLVDLAVSQGDSGVGS